MIETLISVVDYWWVELRILLGIAVVCWTIWGICEIVSRNYGKKPDIDADEVTDTGMTRSELTAHLAAEKEEYGQ